MHPKSTSLLTHAGLLVALFAASVGLTTWRAGLWPFDPLFSAMMTADALARVTLTWWPAWALVVALAALPRRPLWRLALWPGAVAALSLLHMAAGPARGLVALSEIGPGGAAGLYAIPAALLILLGSALREVFRATRPRDQNAKAVPK